MRKILIFILLIQILGACENSDQTNTPQLGKTGDPVIDSLTSLIFNNPKRADLYFQRAKEFYKNGAQGGFDFAIEDMKYAISLDSTNVDYHIVLANIYTDYAQSRLAINTLERATELDPTRGATFLQLARLYIITKQYKPALGVIDKILQRDPQNADAYFLMGMAFKEQGDEARAINAFQKAADFDADNRDAFIELGHIFTKRNSPLALKFFDNALLIDSLDFEAMMGKAYYLQTVNRVNEAVEVYKNIIRNNPRYENALFNLGLLYLERDSLEQAYKHFDIVLNIKPSFYKAYYYRGLIEEKRGNTDRAMYDYRQSLAFNSTYQNALDAIKRLEKR